VVAVGYRPHQSAAPKSNAFVPSVATIGFPHPADEPSVQRAGSDGGHERTAITAEPGVVSGRVLRDDDDVERESTGYGQVDAACITTSPVRVPRRERRERQHRDSAAPGDTRRGKQETRTEETNVATTQHKPGENKRLDPAGQHLDIPPTRVCVSGVTQVADTKGYVLFTRVIMSGARPRAPNQALTVEIP
jgi:hypothetical protein